MKIEEALEKISEVGMTHQFFCKLHRRGSLKDYLLSYSKLYHPDILEKVYPPNFDTKNINPLYPEMTTPLNELRSIVDYDKLVDKLEKIATYNQLRELLINTKKEVDEANQSSQKYKEENEILKKNQLDPDQIKKSEDEKKAYRDERDKYKGQSEAYETFLDSYISFLSAFVNYCKPVISPKATKDVKSLVSSMISVANSYHLDGKVQTIINQTKGILEVTETENFKRLVEQTTEFFDGKGKSLSIPANLHKFVAKILEMYHILYNRWR